MPAQRSTSHGLLFSAPMALANVAGRKTQTRRLIKPHPKPPLAYPYGQPGQEIWQKETWMPRIIVRAQRPPLEGEPIRYRADEDRPEWKGLWRPSILMPRAATRFTATLIEVRVEPLDHITAEDAMAEGLSTITKDDGQTWKWGIPDRDGLPGADNLGWNWPDWHVDPRQAYRRLWNLIHAQPSPVRQNPAGPVTSYAAYPWSLLDFSALSPKHDAAIVTQRWRGLPLVIVPNPLVHVLRYTATPKSRPLPLPSSHPPRGERTLLSASKIPIL